MRSGYSYLGIKGGILNMAAEENPQVVLHHEGLDVCMLVLLVDLLCQCP